MNIVVLGGCGDMGSYVVHDLLNYTQARITIADYRLDVARAMAAKLGDRVQAVFVDAEDPASVRSVMEGADAAVGCIGPFYRYGLPLVQAAIEVGVNYVDICDDYGPIPDILALDAAAKARQVTVITGLGWTPGITNLLARKGVSELDSAHTVRIYWGGGAADAKGLAVVMHVFYAVSGEVPTYRDGEWTTVRAGTGKEVVDFGPPLGQVHVSHCGHPEPLTLPRYLPVKTVTLQGGLTPAWNNWLAEFLVGLGLSRTHKRIATASKIIYRLEGIIGAGGIPYSGARVDVYGQKDDRPVQRSFTVVDKQGRLTGIPAAIGAAMLAEGRVQKGVFAPEGCLEPEPFLVELARRGVHVNERG